MTVLDSGHDAARLRAVTLSMDEMQCLRELSTIDELPVVLNAVGRYDDRAAHDTAMTAAAASLTARGLLDGDGVHPELAGRLRVLHRPHWVLALRWYVGGRVDRLCLARGPEFTVVALRGPVSYVLDEAGPDPAGTVLAALAPAEPLALTGMNAPTAALASIFDDAADVAATTRRLARVGEPDRDAEILGSALAQVNSYAEIVGVRYGEGIREIADGHLAVYDTRHGRILARTGPARDGTRWTALTAGTGPRVRGALTELMNSLPMRQDFPPVG